MIIKNASQGAMAVKAGDQFESDVASTLVDMGWSPSHTQDGKTVDFINPQTGKTFVQQYKCKSSVGDVDKRIDFLLRDDSMPSCFDLGIEAKFQSSGGSVEEKVIATAHEIKHGNINCIIVVGGDILQKSRWIKELRDESRDLYLTGAFLSPTRIQTLPSTIEWYWEHCRQIIQSGADLNVKHPFTRYFKKI